MSTSQVYTTFPVFSSPIHSLTAFWFHHLSNFPTGKCQGLILLSLAIIHDRVVCSPPSNFYLKCITTLSWFFLYCHWPAPLLYPFWALLLSLNIHIIHGSSFTAICAGNMNHVPFSCTFPGFANESQKYVSSQIPSICLLNIYLGSSQFI